MAIWHSAVNLERINAMQAGTINEVLGIQVIDVGEDSITGTMPVDSRTHQPMGILHGGASVVLAESLGSMAGNLCVDISRHYCVGLDINANHLRSVRSGLVTGVARPIHLGRTTQVWDIRLSDDAGKPVCIARLTLAVMSHNRPSA